MATALARTWREQWRWEGNALRWAAEVDDLRSRLQATEQELAARVVALEECEGTLDHQQAELDERGRQLDAILSSRRFRLADRMGRALERARRMASPIRQRGRP
jgi:hypothetical protein